MNSYIAIKLLHNNMRNVCIVTEVASCSENSLSPAASEEVNFSKCWKNPSSVHIEVLRGKKLREQKLKSHPVIREYDVVDIDFDKPSCSTNRYLSTNRFPLCVHALEPHATATNAAMRS